MKNKTTSKQILKCFLKVFNLKDKKKFLYNDVKDISKMAIKRLIKGNKNSSEAKDVILELSEFFARFMFEICNKNIKDGLTVDDLKKLGCVEKKSLILKFPTEEQVPKEYIFDKILFFLYKDN